ncbi:FG-GAP protein [Pseudoscourfieldia marina]
MPRAATMSKHRLLGPIHTKSMNVLILAVATILLVAVLQLGGASATLPRSITPAGLERQYALQNTEEAIQTQTVPTPRRALLSEEEETDDSAEEEAGENDNDNEGGGGEEEEEEEEGEEEEDGAGEEEEDGVGDAADADSGSEFARLETGKRLIAASYTDRGKLGFDRGYPDGVLPTPLSAGLETKPIGVAYVFGHSLPDVFVVNTKHSAEPGLYLYESIKQDGRGVPVFKMRVQVTHPFKGLIPPVGTVIEDKGEIHGFWHVEGNIVAHTRYDFANHGFTERRELHLASMPKLPVRNLAYIPRYPERGGDLVLELSDRKKQQAEQSDTAARFVDPEYNPRGSDASYSPRDSGGIWRGGWLHSALYAVKLTSLHDSPSASVRRVTSSEKDVQFGYCAIGRYDTNTTSSAATDGESTRERGIVAGSYYGSLYYFRNMAESGIALRTRQPILDPRGQVLRHPAPLAAPVVYPMPDADGALVQHLLVGGEGALHFYRFHSHEAGAVPVYRQPVPVTEVGAALYGGSHPIPTVVDWDSDGRTDLLVGTAVGRLWFVKNVGTDTAPVFLPGLDVHADGAPIDVQPGYNALQGPAEARYGFVQPTAVDWDNDGDNDLLVSDARGAHVVFMNSCGPRNAAVAADPNSPCAKGVPMLGPALPLYSDGLEVHGPWRVKPAAARFNGRMVYMTLDDANEVHAYYRVDSQNLKDAGKVRLRTGKPIKVHRMTGPAIGRVSLILTDFDCDGVLDLLMAVPKHASVPEPDAGLPTAQGVPGSVLLFLRGKRESAGELPRFRHPEIIHYNGIPLMLGKEDGSAAVVNFGSTSGPHILGAEEGGRFVYYERKQLSCESYNRFPENKRGASSSVVSELAMPPPAAAHALTKRASAKAVAAWLSGVGDVSGRRAAAVAASEILSSESGGRASAVSLDDTDASDAAASSLARANSDNLAGVGGFFAGIGATLVLLGVARLSKPHVTPYLPRFVRSRGAPNERTA